jgi:TonB family protein
MIGKEKKEAESNIHEDYAATLLSLMDNEAAAVKQSQEKIEPSGEVDVLMSDLLKQVITESNQLNPAPKPTKAEGPHVPIGTQKPKADILKPAKENLAVFRPPGEKSASAKAPSTPPISKPAATVLVAPAKRKNKVLYIAIACFCALAAIGIPVYIFTGSASHVSKPGESPHADGASSPTANSNAAQNNLTPAVPIVKIVPKYPDLGARKGVAGSVILELSIESDGTVVNASPVSGPPVLYNAAIDTANQWRFKPASLAGKNVPSRSRITLYFRPGN